MDKESNPIVAEHHKTKEYKFHQQALLQFENMSRKEKLQTLIDAGIYNKELELTKRYGGKGKS
jgi:hypothetical protein